jgi:hypothetical protein
MRRRAPELLVGLGLLVIVLAALALAPAAARARWVVPVDGQVIRAFAVGPDRFARGQHRGVDLGAPRGSPVRCACAGHTTFVGRVPRGGLTVSVRCGALVATYQQLGAIAVRARRRVGRGALLGSVGVSRDPRERRAHLHLGVREAASGRYLDPLTLLAAAPRGSPLLPPGVRIAPRAVPLGPAPLSPRSSRPRPLPASPRLAHEPVPASPRAAPRGLERGLPWTVWVGLASVGIGLPIGGVVRLRQRRRSTSRVARTA